MNPATEEAAETLIVKDKLFIGGEWKDSTSTDTIEVINSYTEQVMGSVPAGTPVDVDFAVEAARAALPAWKASPRRNERVSAPRSATACRTAPRR